ncbi:MAG TPA: hypothetical protein DCG33_06755 [Prevotellaceae bacterium]|nr:hypothetical protein [Prevotellaceae bacterium]
MATLSLDFLRNYRLGTYRESEPVAYQYDQGHVLDILVPGAVASAEVQYWTRGMTEAAAYEVGSITQQTDGSYVIECNVPNEFFDTWGDLRVYLVVTDDSKYVVTYEGRIKVLQREKPEDYVDDDPDNEALRVLTEAREAAQSASADADRAAQVAASIPADYSELSGNVSNLTQEVSSINERLDDFSLDDLSNVQVENPANGQALVYNSGSNKWMNGSVASPTDAQVEQAVSEWLDEHPEATTTIVDGSVTIAKLASDVQEMIQNAANSAQLQMSNILKVGKIFTKPDGLRYCGWPFNNVQYDSDLNAIIFLINAAVQHGDNANTHLYIGKMMLDTYEVSIAEIGNPTVLGHGFYTMGFCINADGEYLYVDAQSKMLGKSSDKGVTWIETSISEYSSWPESLTQLSNGRYLFWDDGSAKGVWYSDDDCATWTRASMVNAAFEGHFLELTDGKVICYMRKSTNSTNNGAYNGTKVLEPIVVSISDDYGTTWSNATDSQSLINGSANVATAFYHKKEDLIEVFTSPRYPYGDTKGAIFQYMAKKDDALNDRYGTGKVVTYAKALAYQDFGHIGGCFDDNGDMHLMYYDGDSSVSGSVNYYYLKGSRGQAEVAAHTEDATSVFIPYSAFWTESRINAVKKNLQNQINAIIISGGGEIDDPDFYVTDKLVIGIDFTDATKVDSDNGTITDIFGTSFSGTFDSTGKMTGNVTIPKEVLQTKIADNKSITLEVCADVTTASGSSNDRIFRWQNNWTDLLLTRQIVYRWTDTSGAKSVTVSINDWTVDNGGLFNGVGKTQIVVVWKNDGTVLLYRNKVLINTYICADWVSYAALISQLWTLIYSSKYKYESVRIYNKELSVAEIEQNYNYMNS